MEDDLQAVAVGIEQDVLVELNGLLLVAAEEVDLDALHANLLQPGHLLVAGNGCRHAVARRLRGVVLVAVGVVPQHQADALRLGILRQLLNLVAADALVPPVVDQAVLEAHLAGEVNELHLVGVVDALVLPDEPRPCVAARLVVYGRFVFARKRGQPVFALDDGLQRGADDDGAPRRGVGKGNTGKGRAVAVVLTSLGEGDGVARLRCIVAQVAAHVAAVDARLTDQRPQFAVLRRRRSPHPEQAGERVPLPELRPLGHGLVNLVVLLVAGLRALPARHRAYLRTEERRRALGEIERADLAADDATLRILARAGNLVAVGHAAVRHVEDDRHLLALGVGKRHGVAHGVHLAAWASFHEDGGIA